MIMTEFMLVYITCLCVIMTEDIMHCVTNTMSLDVWKLFILNNRSERLDEKDVGDLSDEEDSVTPSTIGKFVRYSYRQTRIDQTVSDRA